MMISGDWLNTPATQAVFSMLTQSGHQAYLVGGCVRNALLGEPVSDLDISTDALPETVSNLAENAGFKAIPTGIDHGTITVVANGIAHEITTFRKDKETDGRRAVVAFSDSMIDDARRRDFTMNALYADATGRIVDPLGGLADLRGRRIRFIGNARDRIAEDYLRILRFFRFSAWYADPEHGFDPDALDAIAQSLAGIETLSKERIGQEIRKLLLAPDPAPAVAVMQQTGVLQAVLSGADAKALPILLHLEQSAGVEPDFLRRLAALGGQDVADNLRLSKSEARDLAALMHGMSAYPTAAEAGYRLGSNLGLSSRFLLSAMLETNLESRDISDVARGAKAALPISAADLMPKFSGAALGTELKRLETLWIASDFTLTRDALLER